MQTRVLATTATALTLSAVALLTGTPAIAHSESIRLTPGQAQALSRDLVHLNSQDFFNQGREQFERETQSLYHKRRTTPLLQVDVTPVNENTPPPDKR